ncbi:hypothetical protein HGA13_12225 [Nocardia speluncae]|uniref:Uncharacterized protein n=1 Tax=Nocardia speluncae TaxID=419477 RepID=A0A846XF96_9NOCA|nr:hypothetical protein [Nocardia speluncae]NKY33839.1 hypothetical protein [Nocardia speluncae]
MNYPNHHPNSSTAAEQSGSAQARLDAAFALPFGPVREQRITEAVLELIAAEIGHRKTAIA